MDLAQVFLTPQKVNHRQYEALRAYFVERLPAAQVAKRFGYTVGSFHQLAHQFRQDPERPFFAESPRPGTKAREAVREQIIELRKQNRSIYDISEALKNDGIERTGAVASETRRTSALDTRSEVYLSVYFPGVLPPTRVYFLR